MSPVSIALSFAIAAATLQQVGTATAGSDRAAIVQAALDYAEGYYSGAPDRMTRAVSPLLTKRGLMRRSGASPFLVQMNAEMLIDATRGGERLPAAARHITAEALDVTGEIASARVFTAQFNDYLHLVKRDDRWQLVNVLWHPPPPAAAAGGDPDRAGVERAVRAYVAALSAADAPGLSSVLHPLATLRTSGGAPGRPRVVTEQNAESLVARLAAGQLKLPGKPEDARVEVQGVDVDIAAAKLAIGPVTTYLHLANTGEAWRVVNTLAFTMAAPAPPKP